MRMPRPPKSKDPSKGRGTVPPSKPRPVTQPMPTTSGPLKGAGGGKGYSPVGSSMGGAKRPKPGRGGVPGPKKPR